MAGNESGSTNLRQAEKQQSHICHTRNFSSSMKRCDGTSNLAPIPPAMMRWCSTYRFPGGPNADIHCGRSRPASTWSRLRNVNLHRTRGRGLLRRVASSTIPSQGGDGLLYSKSRDCGSPGNKPTDGRWAASSVCGHLLRYTGLYKLIVPLWSVFQELRNCTGSCGTSEPNPICCNLSLTGCDMIRSLSCLPLSMPVYPADNQR